MRKSWIRKKT